MKESKLDKAVALSYDPDKSAAPAVVAKGRGFIAERIKTLAEEYDIPLQQDQALADYLMTLDLYEEIPPQLYQVVAEILAFVYSMDKKY